MNITNIELKIAQDSFDFGSKAVNETVITASNCVSYVHNTMTWNKVLMIFCGVMIFLWFLTAYKAGWFKKDSL